MHLKAALAARTSPPLQHPKYSNVHSSHLQSLHSRLNRYIPDCTREVCSHEASPWVDGPTLRLHTRTGFAARRWIPRRYLHACVCSAVATHIHSRTSHNLEDINNLFCKHVRIQPIQIGHAMLSHHNPMHSQQFKILSRENLLCMRGVRHVFLWPTWQRSYTFR